VSRRLHSLLFILWLLWQPLSSLLPAVQDQRAEAISHAFVHDQAIGHHHQEDASLHLGEADETPHQHVLDGGQLPALVVHIAGIEPATATAGVRLEEIVLPPSAVLEGPLRPPRGKQV